MAVLEVEIRTAMQRQANDREGTMFSLATLTTLESLDKLRSRYALTTMVHDSSQEQILWDELFAFVAEQVRLRVSDAFYDDYPTALRALKGKYRNEEGREIDRVSFGYHNNQQGSFLDYVDSYGIPLGFKNIVALLWEATKHEEHLQVGVTIVAARDALITAIANGLRGGNRNNAIGLDDHELADNSICGVGYFNQIGECWKSIHQDTSGIILNFEASLLKILKVQYCKKLLVFCNMDLAWATTILTIINHQNFHEDISLENIAALGLPYSLADITIAIEFSKKLKPATYEDEAKFVNMVIAGILEDPEFNDRLPTVKTAIREQLGLRVARNYLLALSYVSASHDELLEVYKLLICCPQVLLQESQRQKAMLQWQRQVFKQIQQEVAIEQALRQIITKVKGREVTEQELWQITAKIVKLQAEAEAIFQRVDEWARRYPTLQEDPIQIATEEAALFQDVERIQKQMAAALAMPDDRVRADEVSWQQVAEHSQGQPAAEARMFRQVVGEAAQRELLSREAAVLVLRGRVFERMQLRINMGQELSRQEQFAQAAPSATGVFRSIR